MTLLGVWDVILKHALPYIACLAQKQTAGNLILFTHLKIILLIIIA